MITVFTCFDGQFVSDMRKNAFFGLPGKRKRENVSLITVFLLYILNLLDKTFLLKSWKKWQQCTTTYLTHTTTQLVTCLNTLFVCLTKQLMSEANTCPAPFTQPLNVNLPHGKTSTHQLRFFLYIFLYHHCYGRLINLKCGDKRKKNILRANVNWETQVKEGP